MPATNLALRKRAAELAGSDWWRDECDEHRHMLMVTRRNARILAAHAHPLEEPGETLQFKRDMNEVKRSRDAVILTFKPHWPRLVKTTWTPLLLGAMRSVPNLATAWTRVFSRRVLWVAIDWALAHQVSHVRSPLRGAVTLAAYMADNRVKTARSDAARVVKLEEKVGDLLCQAADLLRERRVIYDRGMVQGPWFRTEGPSLWSAFVELTGAPAMALPRAPELEDVLRVLAADWLRAKAESRSEARFLGEFRAAAAIANSAHNSPSERVRHFYGMLDERFPSGGPKVSEWLPARGVADLLGVVAGPLPDGRSPYTEQMVRPHRMWAIEHFT